MDSIPMPRLRASALCIVLAVSGCARFSNDGGFDVVQDTARARLGRDVVDPSKAAPGAIDGRIAALLAEPLSADAAVQVALLSNRELRARYLDLGIAEADLVQAGRLPNPGIDFKRTRGNGDTIIERTFLVDLTTLVMLPLVSRIEAGRFDAVRLEVADALLRTAAETRRAWIDAVAAEQRLTYAKQVADASEAAADLAARMRAAGNWSALAESRERAFHADARADLHRAAQSTIARRERLTRLLGLSGEAIAYRLDARLPDLPDRPVGLDDAERHAMTHRLDLEADRIADRRLAQSLGLAQATRFVHAVELGRNADDRSGGPAERGYEIRVELPVFDLGDARIAKSRAIVEQARERTVRHALDAQSDVRERVAGYRNAWALARHYRDVVLPLKQRISAENRVRYNGMLIGVFELIADAREQIAGVVATLDASRDFWIAEADLAEALGGRLPPQEAP